MKTVTKLLGIIALAAVIGFTMAACSGGDGPETSQVAVTGVTLNQPTLTMKVGDSPVTLTHTVNPSNATNKTVTWTSGNTNVATVNNGVVTAVAQGTAAITVKTADGGHEASCAVTVNPAGDPGDIAVTGVTLDRPTLTMTVGDSPVKLTHTVTPNNATNKNVTWSSSNDNAATVSNGTVTAVAEGNATITVKTADGNKTATCEVTVNPSGGSDPEPGLVNFTITFNQITDAAPSITGPTIYLTGSETRTTATLTVTNPNQYTGIIWHITGTGISESGNSIKLDSGNTAYNRTGEHFLTVEVEKDGIPYNKTVIFTVAE